MPNRLAQETSPYLLQHANNPVDWYAWGEEAISRARAEDKPIFLSIGYAACHWCHVMEHESFEDAQIAELMNDRFVNIKVDREERPDLDHIYMSAVQILTGHGGWPMSVFLTPELQPFYGGTYFPPHGRMGMPGFVEVLSGVDDAWKNRRDDVTGQAANLTQTIEQHGQFAASSTKLDPQLLPHAAADLERKFDHTHGGFGAAPKFPHTMDLRLLLRVWHRRGQSGLLDMVRLTLDKMAGGGLYDHLGGGFHRYSVDQRWLVPHFEKMLYDNALLAGCYLEAFLATGEQDYARVVRETLDYILRDMTHPQGGFYSTLDADSEGVEGKFYVWSLEEVTQVLGTERAELFCRIYDVTERGNFEESNILNRPKTRAQAAALAQRDSEELEATLAECRAALLPVRNQRIHPGLDDKILTSWNALAIETLAEAGAALGEPRYLQAARRAADFIWTHLRREDGRLLHCWREGRARFDAYLDDYGYLTNALVSLYEATFDEELIDRAVTLADVMLARFADSRGGGFYFTADDHEELITRTKDVQDGSVPSGNSMAATALLRLGKLAGRSDFLEAAERTLAASVEIMQRWPSAAGQSLLAYDLLLGPSPEIAVLGSPEDADTATALASLRGRFVPRKVLALRDPAGDKHRSNALAGLFAGKQPAEQSPTVFVCENFACQEPVSGKQAVETLWDQLDASK